MTLGVRTNAIFREALNAVLDLEIDGLARAGQKFSDRRLARVFGGDGGVLRELQRLRDGNAAEVHFELGPYHNALLYSFVVDAIRDLPPELLVFDGGRYRVQRIDDVAFEDALFPDTDFTLPADALNGLDGVRRELLGADDGVFGVANRLAPHAAELRLRPGDAAAIEPIVELTEAAEAVLRRRHERDPAAVLAEVESMGWVYRRGAAFPYWPEWLDPGAVAD